MTIRNDRPKAHMEAYLHPLGDEGMVEQFPTLERFQREDVDAPHVGLVGVAHDPFWVVQKRFGAIALQLCCVRGIQDDEGMLRGCGATLRVSTGRYSWSARAGRPPVERNGRKLRVLSALARLGGTATVGALAIESGLDRNVVDGCLAGGAHAKSPYVTRSASRETTPNGSAHTWALSARGRAWIAWAVSQGLLRGPRSSKAVSDG